MSVAEMVCVWCELVIQGPVTLAIQAPGSGSNLYRKQYGNLSAAFNTVHAALARVQMRADSDKPVPDDPLQGDFQGIFKLDGNVVVLEVRVVHAHLLNYALD